jgi:hypothetical protein
MRVKTEVMASKSVVDPDTSQNGVIFFIEIPQGQYYF